MSERSINERVLLAAEVERRALLREQLQGANARHRHNARAESASSHDRGDAGHPTGGNGERRDPR